MTKQHEESMRQLKLQHQLALIDRMEATSNKIATGLGIQSHSIDSRLAGVTHVTVEQLTELTLLVADLMTKQTLLEIRLDNLTKDKTNHNT